MKSETRLSSWEEAWEQGEPKEQNSVKNDEERKFEK